MIILGNFFSKEWLLKILKSSSFVLILANILVAVFFSAQDWVRNYRLDKQDFQNIYKYSDSIKKMYLQTLDKVMLENFNSVEFRSDKLKSKDKEQNSKLVSKSKTEDVAFLRDVQFWSRAEKFPFIGDQVEINRNLKLILGLKEYYFTSTQYLFGLSSSATTPWVWFTYQFTHSNLFHFLSNLFFLFFVTSCLVLFVNSSWIISTYILGGIGAGFSYLIFEKTQQVAMVGASGSIYALFSFLAIVAFKKNIPWSYFVSPIKDGYGVINLPAYLIFPIYLVSDFTMTLFYPSGVGVTIAHSAHIGGVITGVSLGLFYHLDHKIKYFLLQNWGTGLPYEQKEHLRNNL